MAILTVPLMLVLLLIVAGGRYVNARAEVDAAARDAARAASFARSAEGATSAARHAAAASLDESDGITCRDLAVAVDVSAFAPGGSVSAEVSCNVSLSDVSLLRLPVSRAITARAVAPVDTFRGVR